MDVRDEWIPDDLFAAFTERMPQVCVEILLRHDGGVLVARRVNEPARGEWFWPGGRLYKGEALVAGARRIAREELGIEVELERLLGVYGHFWETSAVEGQHSRHTVNVAYVATPSATDFEIELDDQHSAYRFVQEAEPELHEYVRQYIEDGGFFG